MRLVFFGLSITSSWGNGHATTFRSLLRALAGRGHEILFLEREQPWYAEHRDLPEPGYCRVALYDGLASLRHYRDAVLEADCVVVGSYVPEGAALSEWVTRTARGAVVFFDIDTPVTLAQLARGSCPYLSRELVPRFDLYLSFTGGPTPERLEAEYGARRARAFYCSADPQRYYPEAVEARWDLAYLGTYSDDRQPALEALLVEPARRTPKRRFAVAGPLYPKAIRWPENVCRIPHLSPGGHRAFYNAQRFTLNVTRQAMVRAGWSPSVRLFEAAACGTPIISDAWPGLDEFFRPGEEILVARTTGEVEAILRELPEEERRRIGEAGRRRVLAAHTAEHRAEEFERLVAACVPGEGAFL